MADQTHQTPEETKEIDPALSTTLAMIGGGGIILIMIAFGIGVINTNADGNAIAMLIFAGLALLVFGVGAWIVAVQPHKNFDDINVPQYHGHHHDDHADEIIADAQAVLPPDVEPEQAGEVHVAAPDLTPDKTTPSH